jgi:hypothetical protein
MGSSRESFFIGSHQQLHGTAFSFLFVDSAGLSFFVGSYQQLRGTEFSFLFVDSLAHTLLGDTDCSRGLRCNTTLPTCTPLLVSAFSLFILYKSLSHVMLFTRTHLTFA